LTGSRGREKKLWIKGLSRRLDAGKRKGEVDFDFLSLFFDGGAQKRRREKVGL